MIRIKFSLTFFGLILFSVFSWDCTKIDTTNLGSELIPAVDNVNTFDTIINVIANNFDSIPFGKGCATILPVDEHVLGYIGNDPLFGTTKAIIYTELKPTAFPFGFAAKPADRTLDSVVLVLSYKRTYGDSSIQQRVEVHEIENVFKPDSLSCTFYPFKPAVLGATTYIPARLSDSIKAFRDTSKNQLRIKLSNTFGQFLLAMDSIRTDSIFKNIFKGFAIVPDNSGNALTYYSIASANTKLAIYYKYKRTNLADTSVVSNFGLFNGDRSANNIVRNRSGAEINNSSNANSKPEGDNFIYIQTSPGSYAELKIPGLTGISNRIVHRAELIMDQVYSTSSLDNFFSPPEFLFLDLTDSSKGAYHAVPCDFNIIEGQPNIGVYGGFKTFVTDPFGKKVVRYSFNISRFVQKIITNKKINPILRLSAPAYVVTPGYVDECNFGIPPLFFKLNNVAHGRVKLVGGNFAQNRIRLRIVYSRI